MIQRIFTLLAFALVAAIQPHAEEAPSAIDLAVTDGYADNNGVKIHYVSAGQGPLVVMIHGFPDFWYTWRHQMVGLSDQFQCVAVDLRGYNLSDKPKGVENYDTKILVSDIVAVIKAVGKEKAIICGHDWGGVVAWNFTFTHPEMTEKLIILNLPHPAGLSRELANNPKQQAASQYARDFQKPDAHTKLKPEFLTFWVTGDAAKAKYVEAFKRSDLEAMLNYYKQNYPKEPYQQAPADAFPKVNVPLLMFHGLNDTALLSPALNGTWDWLGKDLTLITVPGASHFVQQDAADLVTRSMRMWLNRDR
jgi:pimeloyl-ACP methyl ester carboxylesterase